MTLNSASTIYIGSDHISGKEEAKKGGRYNRLTRGYCSSKLHNVKYASREAFGFARDVIGSTRRCSIVNKFIVFFNTSIIPCSYPFTCLLFDSSITMMTA